MGELPCEGARGQRNINKCGVGLWHSDYPWSVVMVPPFLSTMRDVVWFARFPASLIYTYSFSLSFFSLLLYLFFSHIISASER